MLLTNLQEYSEISGNKLYFTEVPVLKKLSALILLISACFVFTSCEKRTNSEFSLLPFNTSVCISGGEEEVEADISFKNSDEITIMIKKPENISGITYTKIGEKIVYTKDETTAQAQFLNGAENKNPIAVIFSVLSEMGKQKYMCSQSSTSNGKCEFGEFSFSVSQQNELKSVCACGFNFDFLQK